MKQLLKDKKFQKELLEWVKVFFAIGCFYGVLQLLGITCPIKFVTGISCAGCGMTRAWISALRLDFARAFYYHPIFPLGPLIPFIMVFKKYLNVKVFKAIELTLIISFATVYIYRLVFSDHVVVAFDPLNNVAFRIIRFIKNYF